MRIREGWDYGDDGGVLMADSPPEPAASSPRPILWGQFPAAKLPRPCGISHHGSANDNNHTQQRRLTLALASPSSAPSQPPACNLMHPLQGLAYAPPHSPPDSERIDASVGSSRLHPSLLIGAIDRTLAALPQQAEDLHTVPHVRIRLRRSLLLLRFGPRVRPKLRQLHPNHCCCPSRPSVHISAHLFTCEEFLAANCAWRFVCGGSSATVRLQQFGRDAFSPEKVLWGYRREYFYATFRPHRQRLHPNHHCCPSRPSVRISAHLFACEEFLAVNCAWRFVCGGSSATVRLRQFGRDAFSPEKVLWGYCREYFYTMFRPHRVTRDQMGTTLNLRGPCRNGARDESLQDNSCGDCAARIVCRDIFCACDGVEKSRFRHTRFRSEVVKLAGGSE
ncbi:hypothetical protein B0H17DRAFT_1132642 [Mycena rosella]|uniref:Uncharacterized protein n=1 Tax=Mycena rosella TaxID=1033263 RepID=A0AAD7DK40_MYCRO|nr:hypothetical protein B0H17DRAFT_1132642 [Mycena rosella]